MNLATRKRLAAPVYWLGWRLIRLADKIDGKQPRVRKATAANVADIPGATREEIIAAFGAIEAKRKAK